MRLLYNHRLGLWLTAVTTSSSTCLRGAQAAFGHHHKAFVPRTLSTLQRKMSSLAAGGGQENNNNNNNMLRVALCQFKATEDKNFNHETCRTFVTRAIKEGAQLIVLPVSVRIARRRVCAKLSGQCFCMRELTRLEDFPVHSIKFHVLPFVSLSLFLSSRLLFFSYVLLSGNLGFPVCHCRFS